MYHKVTLILNLGLKCQNKLPFTCAKLLFFKKTVIFLMYFQTLLIYLKMYPQELDKLKEGGIKVEKQNGRQAVSPFQYL